MAFDLGERQQLAHRLQTVNHSWETYDGDEQN